MKTEICSQRPLNLFGFNEVRINVANLPNALRGTGYPPDSAVVICFEVQILLDVCYSFGINPLPKLRTLVPQGEWKYHDTGDGAISDDELRKIGHRANVVWASALGLVTLKLDKKLYPLCFVVIPNNYPAGDLEGGPLWGAREGDIVRARNFWVRLDNLGFPFYNLIIH